ncbi:MAG: helix-hairpin-helix domain-containing protein [Simplicispira sp.]|nr:helix-hairpin-helix domain-containing protein [Simplicispira sp.]
MLKKFLLLITLLYAAVSFAAVDVNQATAAELDNIKGIGPAISSKILDERKKGAFKDWNDFIARVNGMGTKTAVKFSGQGMTVNGSAYSSAPAPLANNKATAPATAKPTKAQEAAPVAATPADAAGAIKK